MKSMSAWAGRAQIRGGQGREGSRRDPGPKLDMHGLGPRSVVKSQKSWLGAQDQTERLGVRVESGLARGRHAGSQVRSGLQVRLGVSSGRGGAPSEGGVEVE